MCLCLCRRLQADDPAGAGAQGPWRINEQTFRSGYFGKSRNGAIRLIRGPASVSTIVEVRELADQCPRGADGLDKPVVPADPALEILGKDICEIVLRPTLLNLIMGRLHADLEEKQGPGACGGTAVIRSVAEALETQRPNREAATCGRSTGAQRRVRVKRRASVARSEHVGTREQRSEWILLRLC